MTATSVVKGSGAIVDNTRVAGETVTAGQAVYIKSTDNKWWLAQNDGTAEESGTGGVGVALNGGAANQTIAVQTAGQVTIGATVVATTVYIVSSTFGGIAPVADIASTQRLTIIGYATTTGILELLCRASGVQKA